MSGKNEKKIRQLVRRNQTSLVNQSWDCFFDTISQMKLKYRFRLAWKILKGSNIREEEQKKIRKQLMGLCIDKGFSHKLAEEVLKDSPNNQAAKDILSKPKYRVNDKYFNTEAEMNNYLNSIGRQLWIFQSFQ